MGGLFIASYLRLRDPRLAEFSSHPLPVIHEWRFWVGTDLSTPEKAVIRERLLSVIANGR